MPTCVTGFLWLTAAMDALLLRGQNVLQSQVQGFTRPVARNEIDLRDRTCSHGRHREPLHEVRRVQGRPYEGR
jgi:hypothetical protein